MALILPDGGELVDLIVPDPQRIDKNKTAQDLPYLDINDYDLQWIHILSEAWASPLRGFMRESEFCNKSIPEIAMSAVELASALIDSLAC